MNEQEEDEISERLKTVAEDIRFNFGASAVLILIERSDENGVFVEHSKTSGSPLSAATLARNFAIRQDEYTKIDARKDCEDRYVDSTLSIIL